MAQLRTIAIAGAGVTLEGLLRTEDGMEPGQVRTVSLVCHPHPLAGGTMHNKVVAILAKALNAAGLPVLRFNFRGVGRSTGSYDEGRGEADDVRAALDWLAQSYPDIPIVLGGFSFGTWVALPVGAADPRVVALIGAGVPVGTLTIPSLADCPKPKLIIQGAQDEYGALNALRAWYEHVAPPKDLHIVAGASHFFDGHLDEVAATVTHWAAHQFS